MSNTCINKINSHLISLEKVVRVGAVERDSDRSVVGHGVGERRLVVAKDLDHTGQAHGHLHVGLGLTVRLLGGAELVVFVEREAFALHNVLEGVEERAAVAAVVGRHAVDELLGGELHELARLAKVLGLERSECGKGPRGVAAELVGDGRDRAALTPIDVLATLAGLLRLRLRCLRCGRECSQY